jgi:hypothetical protein
LYIVVLKLFELSRGRRGLSMQMLRKRKCSGCYRTLF